VTGQGTATATAIANSGRKTQRPTLSGATLIMSGLAAPRSNATYLRFRQTTRRASCPIGAYGRADSATAASIVASVSMTTLPVVRSSRYLVQNAAIFSAALASRSMSRRKLWMQLDCG
jgi:hypothetical protein